MTFSRPGIALSAAQLARVELAVEHRSFLPAPFNATFQRGLARAGCGADPQNAISNMASLWALVGMLDRMRSSRPPASPPLVAIVGGLKRCPSLYAPEEVVARVVQPAAEPQVSGNRFSPTRPSATGARIFSSSDVIPILPSASMIRSAVGSSSRAGEADGKRHLETIALDDSQDARGALSRSVENGDFWGQRGGVDGGRAAPHRGCRAVGRRLEDLLVGDR
jgi:hypothetical protein